MQKYKNLKQDQILKVILDLTAGHEQHGWRPVIVVSNNSFNKCNGGLIKIVPITSNDKSFPLHIPLPNNLKTNGVVEIEHERTLDLAARPYKLVEIISESFLQNILI